MATIAFQLVETGQTTLNKTVTLPDAHLDRLIAAYQSAANTSVGGAATRAQVLNYWIVNVVMGAAVTFVFNSEYAAAQSALNVSLITPT